MLSRKCALNEEHVTIWHRFGSERNYEFVTNTYFNNCLAKWMVGAWCIQGLPWHCGQRAPGWNITLMSGKSPQPSHEPPFQAEGLSELTAGSNQREGLIAEGRHGPDLPKSPETSILMCHRYITC